MKAARKELANYSYLGLGSFVEVDYTQPDIKYTLVGTAGGDELDTGDIYRGLDRFGHVKDLFWYDNAYDELYAYDGLYRLKDMRENRKCLNRRHARQLAVRRSGYEISRIEACIRVAKLATPGAHRLLSVAPYSCSTSASQFFPINVANALHLLLITASRWPRH